MAHEEPLDFTMKTLKEERLPKSEPTYIFESYPYQVPVYPYLYPLVPVYPIPVPSSSGSARTEQFAASLTLRNPPHYQPKIEREPNFTTSADLRSRERTSYEVTTTTLSPTYLLQRQPSPARETSGPVTVSQEECVTPNVMADVDILAEDPEYIEFEANSFRAMAEKNGGSLLGSNPRMRRVVGTSNATTPADDSYRKQREKNNLAAKQSRDRRKKREMQLAFKVTFLSNKIEKLKQMLSVIRCTRCQQRCDDK